MSCPSCGCAVVEAVNVPGISGANGKSAYALTTNTFQTPPDNNQTTDFIPVDTVAFFFVGQTVGVVDTGAGGGIGYWTVATIDPVNLLITLTYGPLSTFPGNTVYATFIHTGTQIFPVVPVSLPTFPISIANGGTGQSTAPLARGALGAAALGVNSDITQLTGITTPITIGEGGTGAATVSGALTNLGMPQQILVPATSSTVVLSGGTKSITGITITANSIILVSLVAPGGTRTSWAGYKVTSISTGVGTGSFVITAIADTGSTLGSCTDTVNYIVIN